MKWSTPGSTPAWGVGAGTEPGAFCRWGGCCAWACMVWGRRTSILTRSTPSTASTAEPGCPAPASPGPPGPGRSRRRPRRPRWRAPRPGSPARSTRGAADHPVQRRPHPCLKPCVVLPSLHVPSCVCTERPTPRTGRRPPRLICRPRTARPLRMPAPRGPPAPPSGSAARCPGASVTSEMGQSPHAPRNRSCSTPAASSKSMNSTSPPSLWSAGRIDSSTSRICSRVLHRGS
jgi:hypothetical protein